VLSGVLWAKRQHKYNSIKYGCIDLSFFAYAVSQLSTTQSSEMACSWVYTWGLNVSNQCGHDEKDNESHCVYPTQVRFPPRVALPIADVRCGECSVMVLDARGRVWMSGKGGRTGYSEESKSIGPSMWREVEVCAPLAMNDAKATAKVIVTSIAVGESHAAAIASSGLCFTWGKNASGCLGHSDGQSLVLTPAPVLSRAGGNPLLRCTHASLAFCTSAVLSNGALFTWGRAQNGVLGRGGSAQASLYPVHLPIKTSDEEECTVVHVHLGSAYAGCVTGSGDLFMWGYGRHGNLGLGARKSHSTPQLVSWFTERGIAVASVHCTVGQINFRCVHACMCVCVCVCVCEL
jgi:alpha-tubulin suppressor-like RCC1 family protein